jgi:predicted transcriptional regulator
MTEETSLIEMTSDIVSAYVGQNNIAAVDLPMLIQTVFKALNGVAEGAAPEGAVEPLKPAVPVRKSITPDYLISLEDGQHYKSLKRHLRAKYGMSPEQYRQKWNLPKDYPMVAPNYSASRSALAKTMGLGQGRKAKVETKPVRKPRAAKAEPAQ